MAISLQYEKRDMKVSPNAIRKAGKIPAVFYGRKQTSTPITIEARDFEKAWKKAGEHSIITLQGAGEDVQALLHAVDKHPVAGTVRHADFYVFEKGQKLKIKIPIEFVGISPAVKDLGAVLVKVVHDLEIEAEPRDLPHHIDVDVAPLKAFGDVITAKQISLPKGVSLVVNPDDVIASVYEPKEEVVEAAPVDLSSIEVMQKGKEPAVGEDAAPEAGQGGAQTSAAPDSKKEGKKEAKK
ncbi:MAG: 50S ribosomal protein L25 [Patescibacteria group bacterium]